MKLFRRKSRTIEDEAPDSCPPTYLEATADQGQRIVPAGTCKDEKSPSTIVVAPEANSELIDPAVDEAAAEEQLLDAATAFIPPPPGRINLETHPLPGASRAGFPPLRTPILIPRVNPGLTMPFTRAFAPSLENTHGIDEATFLAFVDHLNVLSVPHAATTILEVSSTVMGFVPLDCTSSPLAS